MPNKQYFFVFGNSAVDYHCTGEFHGEDGNVNVKFSNGFAMRMPISDGPFVPGKKHRYNDDLEKLLGEMKSNGVKIEPQAGGGGPNTALGLSNFCDKCVQFGLNYYDPSIPHPIIVNALNQRGINQHFGNQRETPPRVVIGGQSEVFNLGGRSLDRILNMEIGFHRQIISGIRDENCLAAVVTSPKDEIYIDLIVNNIIKYQKKAFYVVTPSMNLDLCKERMFSTGLVTFSWNDLLELHKIRTDLPLGEKLLAVYELLQGLNSEFSMYPHHIYSTLGPFGFFGSDKDEIYHGVLRSDNRPRIKEAIEKRVGSSNSAGDNFEAAVVYLKTFLPDAMTDISTAGRLASVNAVRHMGYKGRLSDTMYETAIVTPNYLKDFAQRAAAELHIGK